MTREACIAHLGRSLPGLPKSERSEIISDREGPFRGGLVAGGGETGRKRCWREFAGAVHAILEESPHDS